MMVLLEIYLLVSIFSCMKAFPENPGDAGEAAIGYLLFFFKIHVTWASFFLG